MQYILRVLDNQTNNSIIILGVMILTCENRFCVYWKEDLCTLDEIELNILGMCESCIYIDIDDDVLNELRTDQLNKLEEY